ncbi:MAG: hypothetical protein EZS28_021280 [Streblomastix strix]|uniref:Uncharacterized protein n=1 Tax=Streblomastix strix TaxID=222440 RepID=A0A5J4VLT5_9EUKA|nr:MAG: hypothetical protein EZS28_021280 [Streblomastix strix]
MNICDIGDDILVLIASFFQFPEDFQNYLLISPQFAELQTNPSFLNICSKQSDQYKTEQGILYKKERVLEVKAGIRHVLALCEGGRLYSSGFNHFSQCVDIESNQDEIGLVIITGNTLLLLLLLKCH